MARTYNDEKTVQTVKDAVLNGYKQMFADYADQCAEYAEQGYRPHYCVHGTNQWVDYDNICGPCEEGYGSWDEEKFGELAQDEAESFCNDLQKRSEEIAKFWVESEIAATPGSWINRRYVEWLMELHKELDEEMFKKLGN